MGPKRFTGTSKRDKFPTTLTLSLSKRKREVTPHMSSSLPDVEVRLKQSVRSSILHGSAVVLIFRCLTMAH